MGIGLVSDDDFIRELSNLENKSNQKLVIGAAPSGVVFELAARGRGNAVAVPTSLQAVIGETASLDGRQEGLELAKSLGVSASSVSAYKNGATSTASYNTPKPAIVNPIQKARNRIAARSRNKILNALDEITPEKLSNTKAKDLAMIARNLAGVTQVMETGSDSNELDASKPQIVIFAPQVRREESFDVIDISATEVL